MTSGENGSKPPHPDQPFGQDPNNASGNEPAGVPPQHPQPPQGQTPPAPSNTPPAAYNQQQPMHATPYQPSGAGHNLPPVDPTIGARKIKGPAYAMITLGCLMLTAWITRIVIISVFEPAELMEMYLQFLDSLIPPDSGDQFQQEFRDGIMEGMANSDPFSPFAIASLIISLSISLVVLISGIRMRNLKSWELSVASSILMMLPCTEMCCCVLGIPIGIWSLVMLNKREVKDAFE